MSILHGDHLYRRKNRWQQLFYLFDDKACDLTVEELVDKQCLAVWVLSQLIESTNEWDELQSLKINAFLPSLSSGEINDLFFNIIFREYASFWTLTDAMLHHSSVTVKMTDDRCLDFMNLCQDYDKYISEIYLFLFSVTRFLDSSQQSADLSQKRNAFAYDARLPAPKFRDVHRTSFRHPDLHCTWISFLGCMDVLNELCARRNKILGEIAEGIHVDLIPIIASLKRQVEGLIEPEERRTTKDITEDLGLTRKSEPAVRRMLRALQARGVITTNDPGQRFVLNDKEYKRVLPYLKEHMLSLRQGDEK
jgi:hypothetical protein